MDACTERPVKKVVIAEDDHLTGSVYVKILEDAGFEVALASDGEAFLSLVGSFRPNAVLVDLMLPKLAGIDAIRRLRADEGPKLAIVAVTNAFIPGLGEAAKAVGAAEVLNKSEVTPAILVGIFESLLSPPSSSGTGSPGFSVSETGWAYRNGPAGGLV